MRRKTPRSCPLLPVFIAAALSLACALLLFSLAEVVDIQIPTAHLMDAPLPSAPAIAARTCRVCESSPIGSGRCPRCSAFPDFPRVFYGRTVLAAAPAPVPFSLRAPATLITATISADLLAVLQSLPLLGLGVRELATGAGGFERSVDNRANPGHVYYEGYAHALWSGHCREVTSMNPRWGYDFAKPAAPPLLLAFFEAVRRANRPLLAAAESRLVHIGGTISTTLASYVREGRVFADLALQIHFGDDEAGVWHTDAPNSLLHMAVSVRGARTLRSHVSEEQRASSISLVERRLRQVQGDVYITNPASFAHAVEYVGAPTHAERILAIQVCQQGGQMAQADFFLASPASRIRRLMP